MEGLFIQLTVFNKMYLAVQIIYMILAIISIWYLMIIICEIRKINNQIEELKNDKRK